MKSLESLEILWRDNIPKQILYALLIAALIMSLTHILLIQPKQARMQVLLQKRDRLMRPLVVVEKNHVATTEKNSSCDWEKDIAGLKMTGDFSTVYKCVMQEENEREVVSMHFHKNVMGVSVALGFDEIPA